MADRGPRRVPVALVRAHLRPFVAQGATAAWIAERAGVAERTVGSVLRGERSTVHAGTAQALMSVQGRPGKACRVVDSGPTVARLSELAQRHWTVRAIADMAGLSPSTLTPSNLAGGVSEQTEEAVRVVHERLGDREGPAPRAYPWLAQRLAPYGLADIRDGAGIAASTVGRLRTGRPVARDIATRALRWLNTIEADERANRAREEGWV